MAGMGTENAPSPSKTRQETTPLVSAPADEAGEDHDTPTTPVSATTKAGGRSVAKKLDAPPQGKSRGKKAAAGVTQPNRSDDAGDDTEAVPAVLEAATAPPADGARPSRRASVKAQQLVRSLYDGRLP